MRNYEKEMAEGCRGVARVDAFRASLVLLCFGFVGLLSSCNYVAPEGEDSWQNYVDGGMFVTASPSLSPIGDRMVYASACTGHGDIYVMNGTSVGPVRLTHNDDFEASPMFTPDGKRIVFAREHDKFRHVWIMNSNGSHESQLTQGATLDDPQSLSSDGRYLLFSRSLWTGGLGRTSKMYLMRIDVVAGKSIHVGDIAILSPDSRFVIYSDAGELWRLELDGKERNRRRIYGTGWPTDTSEDGRLILIMRPIAGKAWTGEEEIWVLDTVTKSEKLLGIGHSATLFGANRDNVLFLAGADQIPYVTTIDGGMTKRIDCPSGYKTSVSASWDGRGVLVGSYAAGQRSDSSVIFIDFEGLRATTIASIACDGSTFRSP
ncbi:WD40-like Beta Propeller Repeat [Singulisphaera sp. GP187]|uniref:TolB family protein n=1 Tax=Singulisphaera sp. GP187 TaxID=1882752 RepID=UPI000929847F|nr:PD40 domain-containing protein [Singulisphaera sp. GP187]SIO09144.1 WD40-like Beta Propeller Repeat [Singulisphaera sp. GP187]